ncbi:MAG: hypothetical protein IJH07_07285 [Ruminococcus sp.]|nr:hypothetical protein [Ruminococcus sp.]
MRVLFRMAVLAAVVMTLVSCTRIISSPADELRMYSWRGEAENGSTAALTFDDTDGSFVIENDDSSLTLSGLCFADDEKIIICDDESGQNYTFAYRLYGDRVELTYDGSTLTLDKTD